ncbi:chaperone protein dnaJ 1, mitochondrial-like [Zea mays]|uniref:chaperone protein dnaJ 1, mitochondrial-like n=1 Tax=Zea mays TaxID=4577 RepID=UPI0016522A6C|nr:chaperone protein dnaJ 1, mitochondrial-like [Zea mays]
MELLLRRGHVDPSAFAAASLSSKHANAVRTACLRFGRQRPELIRHISRCDIQVALRCGCPSIDRKVVNSGKRLRAYVGLVEGELAKKLHPDTNKGDADAEPKFQEVQRAYEFFRNIFRDRDFGSHDIKVISALIFAVH